jgi:hypothetical protein
MTNSKFNMAIGLVIFIVCIVLLVSDDDVTKKLIIGVSLCLGVSLFLYSLYCTYDEYKKMRVDQVATVAEAATAATVALDTEPPQ